MNCHKFKINENDVEELSNIKVFNIMRHYGIWQPEDYRTWLKRNDIMNARPVTIKGEPNFGCAIKSKECSIGNDNFKPNNIYYYFPYEKKYVISCDKCCNYLYRKKENDELREKTSVYYDLETGKTAIFRYEGRFK